MYGLINRALEELVRSTSGDEGWHSVCTRAGVDIDFFEGHAVYDDAITFDLVDAASTELQTTTSDILERFGRYWILYTSAEGWGPVLDDQGSSVLEVLQNLNNMHVRVTTSMPGAIVPTFHVRHCTSDRIDVEYISERDGLAPMVIGLLRGLSERFDEDWHIVQTGHRSQLGCDTFMLVAAVPAGAEPARTETPS